MPAAGHRQSSHGSVQPHLNLFGSGPGSESRHVVSEHSAAWPSAAPSAADLAPDPAATRRNQFRVYGRSRATREAGRPLAALLARQLRPTREATRPALSSLPCVRLHFADTDCNGMFPLSFLHRASNLVTR